MIHDDGVADAGGEVVKHPLVLRTPLARVRAGVVVDVDVGHRPAAALGEGAAVLDLSGDTCGQAVRVRGDTRIDCRSLRSHQGTLAYPAARQHPVTRPIIGRHPRLTAVVPQPTSRPSQEPEMRWPQDGGREF